MKVYNLISEANWPSNPTKYPKELTEYFKKGGYKFLGSGVYQIAILAPDGTVVKIHSPNWDTKENVLSKTQESYVDFINFCQAQSKIGNTFVPQFFGYEIKNYKVPYHDNEIQPFLIVKTERLFEIKDEEIQDALRYIGQFTYLTYSEIKKHLTKTNIHDDSLSNGLNKIIMHIGENGLKQLTKTFNAIFNMSRQHHYSIDLHSDNFMYSGEGDIVVNDPFTAW